MFIKHFFHVKQNTSVNQGKINIFRYLTWYLETDPCLVCLGIHDTLHPSNCHNGTRSAGPQAILKGLETLAEVQRMEEVSGVGEEKNNNNHNHLDVPLEVLVKG